MSTSSIAPVQVRTVDNSRTDEVLAILMLAFNADPLMRWMFPDAVAFTRRWPGLVRLYAQQSFAHRTAFVTSNLSGAAVWIPPNVHPDETALEVRIRSEVPAARQEPLLELLVQMSAQQPSEPHWYLALIGVDPIFQCQGIGAQLIRPILEQCDSDGTPAYLVSSNPANESFYARLGFVPGDTISIEDAPRLQPFVRRPVSTL